MNIFDRVKMLAKRRGISIPDLEETLGFSSGSLYPHSKNASIMPERVIALSEYFDVSTDWLLTGSSKGNLAYEEWDLLNLFRMMDSDRKNALTQYAAFLAQESLNEKKKHNISSFLS